MKNVVMEQNFDYQVEMSDNKGSITLDLIILKEQVEEINLLDCLTDVFEGILGHDCAY